MCVCVREREREKREMEEEGRSEESSAVCIRVSKRTGGERDGRGERGRGADRQTEKDRTDS